MLNIRWLNKLSSIKSSQPATNTPEYRRHKTNKQKQFNSYLRKTNSCNLKFNKAKTRARESRTLLDVTLYLKHMFACPPKLFTQRYYFVLVKLIYFTPFLYFNLSHFQFFFCSFFFINLFHFLSMFRDVPGKCSIMFRVL